MKTNPKNQSLYAMMLFKPRTKHRITISSSKPVAAKIKAYSSKPAQITSPGQHDCFHSTLHIDTIIAAFLKSISPPKEIAKVKTNT
jgi:hypothetical protein